MTLKLNKLLFWMLMLIAQTCAFLIFKDLADISQWVVQSTREFTMMVWYNRHALAAAGILALLVATLLWWKDRALCHKYLFGFLVLFFCLNFYSGMINPKWMFRSQQHQAMFVPVSEAPEYLEQSLHVAHFGPDSYASVDDINMVVLETDNGAYAYSDYYMLQPHVVQGNNINGEEVIMTYCGLTNLGIAYSPVINDRPLDLTVMTQLKNNLVLFDKNSGEAIQQLWGSKERDAAGATMKEWPTIRMPFEAFKALYPDGKVYINEIAGYSENPVFAVWDRLVRHGMMLWGVGLNWVDNDKPAFPTIDFTDDRLPMKELVYTISINGDHVAYSKDFLMDRDDPVNVVIGGEQLVINYDAGYDAVVAFFNDTGASVNEVDIFGNIPGDDRLARVNTLKSRLFWFIFVEFFPDTDVNRA